MRHLNKIIFINSATIRYQEIAIDGNVHFIGTQGAGKSTVLRAILFFYNADINKLGIPKEKQGFTDYYFANSNSYIIYEVLRESGPFCVLAYKQSGRVAYRFIDSQYDANYFITDNSAVEGWDKVRMKLDELGIDYSKKIERYEEYRNIIYGNNEGKSEFKKYALLESKLYQNIPRTIQNVFLNTKLDAEFIKKTIIDSIMEENVPIDLGIYRHHLQEFENEYKDIETYKTKKSQEKAERIIEYHNHISKAIADKKESYNLLIASVAIEQKRKPILEKKSEKISASYITESDNLRDIEKNHNELIERLNQEKGGWQSKLESAKVKEKKYINLNIQKIMERVSQEGILISKKDNLFQEQNTITTAYKDIEQKFKLLTDQLENELGQFEIIQGDKKNKLTQAFGTQKENINQTFEQVEKEITNQHKIKKDLAENNYNKEHQLVIDLEKQLITVDSTRLYESEINILKNSLRENDKLVSENDSKIKVREAGKIGITKDLEHELELIEKNHEVNYTKLKEQLVSIEGQLNQLNEWLNNSNNTLFGFLNEKYPGWENTLGRVCNEDILFNSNLSPELIEKNGLLFGLKIDLSELETKVKTLDGYNKRKSDLEVQINSIRKSIEQLEIDKLADIEKVRKRLLPKIREHSDVIQQLAYSSQQAKIKLEQLQLDLNELENRANLEKQKTSEEIKSQISKAKAELQKSLEERVKINSEFEEQISLKRSEKNDKIKTLSNQLENDLQIINNAISDNKIIFNTRRIEINDRKHDELQGKGLDTKRLQEIEKEVEIISKEINFINENKKLVIEYEIDLEQYLNKIEEFKANISLKEEEKKNEAEKFIKHKGALIVQIAKIKEELQGIANALEEIDKQLKHYNEFTNLKEYEDLKSDHNSKVESINLQSISDYIGRIRDAHYSIIEKQNLLTSVVNDYSSKFSLHNIFSFKTGFIEPIEYLDFAVTLKEFIDENKIAEFERRVNKRYVEIINLVDKEVTELISKEGDIQQVISKINKDFQEKNFVGAISVIEMRIEDSSNRIVDILKRIKSFNLDGQFRNFSSGPNLFTNDVDEKRINDAISLLAALVKEIKESKNTTINVSDSFELKFRIVENQNDSGWVEKLSNIGSEGTDILVKAMINIMLLNVFKENASRKLKDFKLHCVMDEIGRLHPSNVRGILNFATARNILLINGSPIEHDALAYKHIYELRKDQDKFTRVKRLISSKK